MHDKSIAASHASTKDATPRANTESEVFLYALGEESRFIGGLCDELSIFRSTDTDSSVRAVKAGVSSTVPLKIRPYALRIGVGAENAFRNTSLLFRSGFRPRAAIVVGFAGGLDSAATVGSVIVGDTVQSTISGAEFKADDSLLAAAMRVEPPRLIVRRGPIVSSGRVLVHSSEKHALARSTGAVAVDMESAGAAAAAAANGVRWLAVRVITDGVDDELPFDFNAPRFQAQSGGQGGVDRGRIVVSALLQPWKIPPLIRLGMRTSLASRNLALYLHALVLALRDS